MYQPSVNYRLRKSSTYLKVNIFSDEVDGYEAVFFGVVVAVDPL
jgi:hypothetical protein